MPSTRILPRIFMRLALASTLLPFLASTPAHAWGRDGHMMINYLGAEYLPHEVPAFLRNPNALDVMRYLGPEPDRWRDRQAEPELVAEQAPDHFINMEYAILAEVPCTASTPDCGPDGKMLPRRRYDFIRALAAAQPAHPDLKLTPESVGMQPWEVEEIWQKLKVDFREYRQLSAANDDLAPIETAILYNAAWLGHYVGDGSQPLHVTIQYNGWVGPNPNGYTTEHHIHSEFESVFVSANIKRDDVAPLVAAAPPQQINDEWGQYLDFLHHTNSFVPRVYQLDKQGGFTGAGTPEARSFTDERLAAGAIELRNLIYSAWVHSADPVQQYHGTE
ncbi:MAG TPA: nuclease [Acidobacteriaceae bacterium]|jgi:hypothetical protein|nr:nuclease [Acidobacteriaceae bacterium]